jgi:D-alanyl-D-alanine carboxypeptidase
MGFCLLAAGFSTAGSLRAAATLGELKQGVNARAVLLQDAETGEVVYARNETAAYPPASTVKLLTALLVWEKTKLQGNLTVAKSDTYVEPSHIPLIPGEVVSVRDLAMSLLIGSDNDSAAALARHAGGSVPEFAKLMNQRARMLGCTNSNFINPHGLPVKGQYTTARDLMRIFNAVLAVPELREICQMKGFTLKTRAGSQWVKNHNKLLGQMAGMGPAKTGWTYSSRHTYAASIFREGRELRLTILNSKNKWHDTELLVGYGFSIEPKYDVQSPGDLSRHHSHVVRAGDTLTSISRAYQISTMELIRSNRLDDPNLLVPGMVLVIPGENFSPGGL